MREKPVMVPAEVEAVAVSRATEAFLVAEAAVVTGEAEVDSRHEEVWVWTKTGVPRVEEPRAEGSSSQEEVVSTVVEEAVSVGAEEEAVSVAVEEEAVLVAVEEEEEVVVLAGAVVVVVSAGVDVEEEEEDVVVEEVVQEGRQTLMVIPHSHRAFFRRF